MVGGQRLLVPDAPPDSLPEGLPVPVLSPLLCPLLGAPPESVPCAMAWLALPARMIMAASDDRSVMDIVCTLAWIRAPTRNFPGQPVVITELSFAPAAFLTASERP